MATGTFSATVTGTDRTQSKLIIYGTLAASSGTDTYATQGLVLNLITSLGDYLKTDATAPTWMEIKSTPAAGTSPAGWLYFYCPGTTLALGKVAIFGSNSSATALAEYGNSSALTTIATDTITFRAEFPFS